METRERIKEIILDGLLNPKEDLNELAETMVDEIYGVCFFDD